MLMKILLFAKAPVKQPNNQFINQQNPLVKREKGKNKMNTIKNILLIIAIAVVLCSCRTATLVKLKLSNNTVITVEKGDQLLVKGDSVMTVDKIEHGVSYGILITSSINVVKDTTIITHYYSQMNRDSVMDIEIFRKAVVLYVEQ